MESSETSLVGQLLIAMPTLRDPNFWRTVVLVGVHSRDEGAFGLVINREIEVDPSDILVELGEEDPPTRAPIVLGGGPVQPTHGFVLFEGLNLDDDQQAVLTIGSEITVSGSTQTLSQLLHGKLEGRFYLLLGYSGWAPGQLEQEIEENSWLVAPCDSTILFDIPLEDRWQAALQLIGVDPGTLVDVGSAEPS
ncbi:MAG: YqgE/AlgH family protein [bacterium]|nr:YqgE/AlgH family protein [bacterium]